MSRLIISQDSGSLYATGLWKGIREAVWVCVYHTVLFPNKGGPYQLTFLAMLDIIKDTRTLLHLIWSP